jgi:AraC-like DNA-binding protein
MEFRHRKLALPRISIKSCCALQSARRHIERGGCVREAAALSGFSDAAHLSRTFRDWLGVSPGLWRRQAAQRRVTSIPPR